MKLIYIPKYQKEKTPFKITQIIQRVIKHEKIDGLIFLPGFMSRTQITIKDFVTEMQNLGVSKKIVLLFNGMNGFFQLPSKQSILQEHLNQFSQNNRTINFTQNKNLIDHRKMLFFFKEKSLFSKDLSLTKDKYQAFLSSIEIVGLLIGSSNQSFATYFSTAQKGEADLLMLHDGASFKNYHIDTKEKEKNGKGTLIMAKSDSISDSDEYFKNILRDIFENSF